MGRRLATGFGLVGITALMMCSILLALLGTVGHSVAEMRDVERRVSHSLALASAVREQYIHQARTIVEGSRDLGAYDAWVAKVRQSADALRPELPSSDRPRVDSVLADSRELDRVFRDELLPALDRGDHEGVERSYGKLGELSSRASISADALAVGAEGAMAMHHDEATIATRAGLVVGAGGMLLVIVLSVIYTRRIRHSVVQPLESLSAAARRLGRGDFGSRVGAIGEGEFAAVARAYDKMIEELSARQGRLLRAERMAVLGQLAAGVAHEINNPIAVIRGYLRTMSPADSPEALREELAILDDEAAACQRIAEDLLAYARAHELSPEPVEFAELLGETIRRFRESGEVGAHTIELDVAPHTLCADARRLRQVVLNLVRNAVQMSPDKTPVEVVGSVVADGGYEIRVLDRGPGIPPEYADRIFEPFFSRRDGGSGLGLAVCEGIVRAHGGSITAHARPGGGSELRVLWPAAPPGEELETP